MFLYTTVDPPSSPFQCNAWHTPGHSHQFRQSYIDSTGFSTQKLALCVDDGWTVIQSRGQFGNAENYFNRSFQEYVNGFGETGEELFYLKMKHH